MIKAFKNFKISQSLLRRTFCQNTVKTDNNEEITQNQQEDNIVPIHLRPYDPIKYQKMSSKLKYASGYALLDVEPFPRQKVMKLCYMILEKLKREEIPEEAMYRIYTEEKIKYIMKLTDEIDNVVQLEKELGHETIEMTIQGLVNELTLVDKMKDGKPWEDRPHEEDDDYFKIMNKKRDDFKHLRYDKPDRQPAKFIENN